MLAAGYTLLVVSWAIANPPFAAPDEPAHYLRAVAVGGGSFEGSATVQVPRGLWTLGEPACNKFEPDRSAACLDALSPTKEETSVVGDAGFYPPLSYVLAGVASRLADDFRDADYMARIATAAMSSALFFVTALLVYSSAIGPASLLGLLVAATPMVVFLTSVENSSALETAAGLAFAAGLLRLLRDEKPVPTWVWVAVGTTGLLMTLSRSTGIIWLAFDVSIACALLGGRRLLALSRSHRRAFLATTTALVCAAGVNRAWERTYGSDVTRAGPIAYPWTDKVREAFGQFDRLAKEWVGVFGWLDTPLPVGLQLFWIAGGIALVVGALILGRLRERLVLTGALLLACLAAVLLSATLRAGELGGDIQSRHLMPFLVMIPLLGGHIVTRARSGSRALDALFPMVALAAAFAQALAWYYNARRHAVGVDGPAFFFADPDWAPPLGWAPWGLVALGGASLMVLSARFRLGSDRLAWSSPRDA
jgi:Predicted membrane protein (DUF2142)